MAEIKCPKCGGIFEIDEASYASIAKQVRDSEFAKDLKEREEALARENENAMKLAKLEDESKREKDIKKQEEKLADKDKEIAELKAKLIEKESDLKVAVSEAVQEKEKELSQKTTEIIDLKAKLENNDTEKKLAVSEAVQAKEKELSERANEIVELKGKLDTAEKENLLSEKNLKERYENELKLKDEQIAQIKDFKSKQSTKMIGESLEIYCNNEFNKLRPTAFPLAYFEKDNKVSKASGSKGDFIFKDYATQEDRDNDDPYITIMFEMKNESENTASKHKNEEFFKELDKDRNEKKCEYAVLVSLLEADSDFYNEGIVDVSYRYPKMYVVRPQCFMTIISILRNAARNTLAAKNELADIRKQQVDYTNFEFELNRYKKGFNDCCSKAKNKFDETMKNIDNAIDNLTKMKESLRLTAKHLDEANNKLGDVTVKKLTKNAPSIRAKFDELED